MRVRAYSRLRGLHLINARLCSLRRPNPDVSRIRGFSSFPRRSLRRIRVPAKRNRLGEGRQLLDPDNVQPLLIAIAYWRAGNRLLSYTVTL